MKHTLIALFLSLTTATAVYAETSMSSMKNHSSIPMNPMQTELMAAMAGMNEDMEKGMMNTDADTAFAMSMIPHHQGAVKMAEVQLKYGKDPELRKLAQEIINAQEPEIQIMQKWLEKNKSSAHH